MLITGMSPRGLNDYPGSKGIETIQLTMNQEYYVV